MPVVVGGMGRTCTLRQVARAARMREQSEGCVKRKPMEEEEEDREHQNGDWETSTE